MEQQIEKSKIHMEPAAFFRDAIVSLIQIVKSVFSLYFSLYTYLLYIFLYRQIYIW